MHLNSQHNENQSLDKAEIVGILKMHKKTCCTKNIDHWEKEEVLVF